jgi:murein DD-endopeptidase MepM/ murein hydrolase activator NlpD
VSIPTDAGYVFPVLGEVSFTDDYGAPRAGTGWHQGNDVFGPRGTPLLAVADGTLSKVGVNTLGGNRLWLTDDAGNAFYYAHLSAYAPAAVEGARVTAGQVIGFLGNTGQAITTPPHLHFEVHPGGGDSVNPYPYLIAWQRGTDIPRAFVQAATSPSPAPAVGAVLVDGLPELDTAPPPEEGLATPAT